MVALKYSTASTFYVGVRCRSSQPIRFQMTASLVSAQQRKNVRLHGEVCPGQWSYHFYNADGSVSAAAHHRQRQRRLGSADAEPGASSSQRSADRSGGKFLRAGGSGGGAGDEGIGVSSLHPHSQQSWQLAGRSRGRALGVGARRGSTSSGASGGAASSGTVDSGDGSVVGGYGTLHDVGKHL